MAKRSLYAILGKKSDDTYYDVFSINSEATTSEIDDKFYSIYGDLSELKSKGEISAEEFYDAIAELEKIYYVLTTPEMREKYDEDLKATDKGTKKEPTKKDPVKKEPAKKEPDKKDPDKKVPGKKDPDKKEPAKVPASASKVVSEEEADKKIIKRSCFIIGALSVALVVLIIITCFKGCSKDKLLPGGDGFSNQITSGEQYTQGEDLAGDTDNQENQEQPEQAPVQKRDFGDIADDSLVTERAKTIIEQLDKNGCNVDLATGLPYTEEQVKNIILYINGAYVPESEQDVYDMYFEFLNFMCVLGNTEDVIYQVNYRGGEESFADIIAENAKNPISLDLATAATFGQGYGAEYSRWLQEQYFKILYATNDDDYNKIWAEVWQSYADIMKGNGYTMTVDGKQLTITEQSLLLPENIGVANQINFWLLNFEVFRTNKVQVNFDVVNKYISANEDEQHDTVSFDEMAAYINASCDSTLLDGVDFAVDDEGKTLYTTTTDERGFTWGMLTQYNTKAMALNNLYAKNNTK